MTDRPRFFDDLAGVAGGAMSALAGMREEAESLVRARVDEALRKMDLVRREDLEAVQEMAANARAAQQALEARLAALEARMSGSATPGTGPGAAGTSPSEPPTRLADRGPANQSGQGSEASPGSLPPRSGPESPSAPADALQGP